MADAFALPIREFNRRVAAIAKLERWRQGEDDSPEARLVGELNRFMDRAARGQE